VFGSLASRLKHMLLLHPSAGKSLELYAKSNMPVFELLLDD